MCNRGQWIYYNVPKRRFFVFLTWKFGIDLKKWIMWSRSQVDKNVGSKNRNWFTIQIWELFKKFLLPNFNCWVAVKFGSLTIILDLLGNPSGPLAWILKILMKGNCGHFFNVSLDVNLKPHRKIRNSSVFATLAIVAKRTKIISFNSKDLKLFKLLQI